MQSPSILQPQQKTNGVPKEIPPMQKGQNPKRYVMQNFEELRFVENVTCSQRGQLRLYRFHPFVKYMASKLVCSIPKSSLAQGKADQLLDQYKERCKIKQPHIIYSIASESQVINKNTSQGSVEFYQIFLYFEFSQLTLDQLTEKRKSMKYLLPEPEVWCLIQGVLAALIFFQNRNISHGMISLKNIYFDEEYLLYRVYDQEVINGRWGNWNKVYSYKKGKELSVDFTQDDYHDTLRYLAPETIKYLEFDTAQIDGKVNQYKSDVYSFGVTLIRTLTMKQNFLNDGCYDWLRQFYSDELISIIKICTEINPTERPDWIGLQQKVQLIPDNIQKQQTKQIIIKQSEQEIKTVNPTPNESLNTSYSRESLNNNLQRIDENDVDQKLLQLNQKIQETLLKSFSKTKSLK